MSEWDPRLTAWRDYDETKRAYAIERLRTEVQLCRERKSRHKRSAEMEITWTLALEALEALAE